MKITLTSIAQKTGVAASTVQRALNGSPGVSDAKRKEIQRVAQELGYSRNVFASSLKLGALHIAIVYPDKAGYNRFFSSSLWGGIDQYLDEITSTNIEPVKIMYTDNQAAVLSELASGAYGRVDGVVTRGATSGEVRAALAELKAQGIPVVLTASDSEHSELRLACVKNYETMAGQMAADLLLNFSPIQNGSRVILCGDFSGCNQQNSAYGFERQLRSGGINIKKLSGGTDTAPFKKELRTLIQQTEPAGLYACSARYTVAACEVLNELETCSDIRTIGSDIFPESVRLMREGRLQALMHTRPRCMAFRSMETLVAHLQGGTRNLRDEIQLCAIIVTPGSLDHYIDDTVLDCMPER